MNVNIANEDRIELLNRVGRAGRVNEDGYLSRLATAFEADRYNSDGLWNLIFRTERDWWMGELDGVEAPCDEVIEAIKTLGENYGFRYVKWEACEKGFGDFYFKSLFD